MAEHHYKTTIKWTGNLGKGTMDYSSYGRNHTIIINHKADVLGSSDPVFRGDKTRHSPEDLLLSSLSACHMLWYLHLCALNNVTVVDYMDEATGIMKETEDGSGYFSEITLHPAVKVTDASMKEKAKELHHQANQMCFIARSVNFPVYHKPVIEAA